MTKVKKPSTKAGKTKAWKTAEEELLIPVLINEW
jgi:hypothetical protein